MGEVYRAHDERLQRDVALKVLPAHILADETARKRFRKEALALSKLNHPNIATVHDFDTQDGVDFLVMEYVPGATLTKRITGGALPEKEVAQLGIQIAAALEEAQEQGVVHRDLKDQLPRPLGEPQQLTRGESTWHVHNGGWSPDGKAIVYTRDLDSGDIYVIENYR